MIFYLVWLLLLGRIAASLLLIFLEPGTPGTTTTMMMYGRGLAGIICFLVAFCAAAAALNDEGEALLEFFWSRSTSGRRMMSDWNSDHNTPCGWTGVTCSKDLRVIFINLAGKGLEGNLASLDMSRFTELAALNLSSNAFVGQVPSSFGDAPRLSILNLHSNHLTGTIPWAISRLTNLTYLDLSNNHLRGEIPASLNSLAKLSFLNVSFNDLEGRVPRGGSLASFPGDSFVGNAHLSASPISCNRRARSVVEIGDDPIPESASSRPGSSSSNSRRALSVGAIVAICVCAFAASKLFVGTLCYLRWRKARGTACEVKLSGGKMVMFQLSGKATPSSRDVLRRAQMLKAKDVIGSGGYGTVYRLEMNDKSVFAVKKLARGGQDRERGFERELETLADIKHRNLVALRGYYSSPEINILVYDLMPNGNLDSLLHDQQWKKTTPGEKAVAQLEWDARLNIAIGSARGLSYLHHDCIPHIIHRDIKTSNILLDEDMEARVSDFGLAKLMHPHQTHVTTIVAGTLGYLPPEYMESGKVTEKGDVYSFGIVLLELLTGKRPTDKLFVNNDHTMVQWARKLVVEEHPEDVFDECLLGSCPDEELLAVLDIAFQCVMQQPLARPSMPQVVKMLEKIMMSRIDAVNCTASSSFGFSMRLRPSSTTSTASSNSLPLSQ